MAVHRTGLERRLEQRLASRRRQEDIERQRAARRKRARASGQRDPYTEGRAIVGELIEDLATEMLTVWRERR